MFELSSSPHAYQTQTPTNVSLSSRQTTSVISEHEGNFSGVCGRTTGMNKDADGLTLRRRPNVGAVGVGGLQESSPKHPSA
jgi:hypothetical protein